MAKKISLSIGGMTCINCQNKIEKKLRSLSGVTGVKVSYAKGTADVEYEEKKITRERIVSEIEKLDYKVLSSDKLTGEEILRSVSTVAVIALLYYLLQSYGILNRLAPMSIADSGMGYGMLFVIGLMTSVHCIAMCGGIGLSQSLSSTVGQTGNKVSLQTFLPSLAYNLGRVCSYTIIGLIFGAIGSLFGLNSDIGLSNVLQGVLKIIAGLCMVIMAINMLGIFPALRKFMFHTPMALAKVIGQRKSSARAPFVVGMLNGLMPCGPMQSMWLVALATGSPVAGALSMFVFSLGTVPLMLGLGSVISMLGQKFTNVVMRVGAVMVAVLGLSMLTQGIVLGGWQFGSTKVASAGDVATVAANEYEEISSDIETGNGDEILTETKEDALAEEAGIQEVKSVLALGSYPDITVKKGVPVKWTINAPEGSLSGCNYQMIIQDYGIYHTFDFGDNVIEFVPTESGTVRYSCWMGMIQGTINVVD